MAFKIRVTVNFDWVGDGAGTALLGQGAQANYPGYGAAQGPGAVGVSQTMELRVAEVVPGGDTPSQANFNTALSQAATDIGTMMATPGAYSGGPQTPIALIQAWSTGGP